MRIYGITGWKNSGKTGLVERLVAHFTELGLTVATIKHAHHTFDVDHEGRDSYRHRAAGAREVLLSSRNRWALMHEARGEEEQPLAALLAKLEPADLVLIEGYKRDAHPKIEAHRAATGNPLIAAEDPTIRAVASDTPVPGLTVPVFDLDDTEAVAGFILKELGLARSETAPGIKPPKLRDDCFALPPGVDWTPVDTALQRLRAGLAPVVGSESVPVTVALGRILAADHLARRSNPPGANSAVDGYGFAHASLPAGNKLVLPLAKGRSAAGSPFTGALPPGQAVRILTGALVPPGVDTVIMQEDVSVQDGQLVFAPGIKQGANIRPEGEDVAAGRTALTRGHRLSAADLALLSALGLETAEVFRRLRVGVLSTGDEIVPPGSTMDPARTYDANRPMLLALAQGWGYAPVDLGHVEDSRDALRARLDEAARRTDVIVTSGGASAGEEDHVSALLKESGALTEWRVAIKPGRPLALAMWQGVPVIGLPGNPVAALVCSLIFARPAFSLLAGGDWLSPTGFALPAAFSKRKKEGRREYLRARMTGDGRVEAFRSEGSGLISGLSWADGLIELGEEARDINPGDPVRFLPFVSLLG
jgi:molybdopterin molybdotransferase